MRGTDPSCMACLVSATVLLDFLMVSGLRGSATLGPRINTCINWSHHDESVLRAGFTMHAAEGTSLLKHGSQSGRQALGSSSVAVQASAHGIEAAA